MLPACATLGKIVFMPTCAKLGIFVNVCRLFCLPFQSDLLAVMSRHAITDARCTAFKKRDDTKSPVTWQQSGRCAATVNWNGWTLSISGSAYCASQLQIGLWAFQRVIIEWACSWSSWLNMNRLLFDRAVTTVSIGHSEPGPTQIKRRILKRLVPLNLKHAQVCGLHNQVISLCRGW